MNAGMHRTLCAALFLFAGSDVSAAPVPDFSATSLQPTAYSAGLCSMADEEVTGLLEDLHTRFPLFQKRLTALARRYVGCAPYVRDPLDCEQENWLPFRKTNCTMFVLYAAALANSRSLTEARCHMRFLHYRGGAVGFTTRYHFTADRITDPANRYFSDCTAGMVKDAAALKRAVITLNRSRSGRAFFKGRLNGWTRTVTIDYLPRQGFLPSVLAGVPEAVGIAFVKKELWDSGVLFGHEGLIIDGDLYHSSPGKGVHVVPDYLAAVFPDSSWEGIVFFTLNAVALPECEK